MSYAKSLLDGTPTGAHLSPSQADCERSAGNLRPLGGVRGGICPVVWDGWLCWPPTLGGATIKQPCPDIHNFNTQQYAYRNCLSNGTWYGGGRDGSSGWSNYSLCVLSSSPDRAGSDVTLAGSDLASFPHPALVAAAAEEGSSLASVLASATPATTSAAEQTTDLTQILMTTADDAATAFPLDDVIGSGVHAMSAVCLLLALVTWATLKLTDRLVTRRYLILIAIIVSGFLFHIIVLSSRLRAVALGVSSLHHHPPPTPSLLLPSSSSSSPPLALHAPTPEPPFQLRSDPQPPASLPRDKRPFTVSKPRRAARHVNGAESIGRSRAVKRHLSAFGLGLEMNNESSFSLGRDKEKSRSFVLGGDEEDFHSFVRRETKSLLSPPYREIFPASYKASEAHGFVPLSGEEDSRAVTNGGDAEKILPLGRKKYDDLAIHREKYDDLPIHREKYDDLPIHREKYDDLPIHREKYNDLPIHRKKYDDLPIHREKYNKDDNPFGRKKYDEEALPLHRKNGKKNVDSILPFHKKKHAKQIHREKDEDLPLHRKNKDEQIHPSHRETNAKQTSPFKREKHAKENLPSHRETNAKQTLPFDREEKDDSVSLHRKNNEQNLPFHRETNAKQTSPFKREKHAKEDLPSLRKTNAKQTLPFDREEKDDSVSLHRKTHAKQTLPFDREEKDDSVPLHRKTHAKQTLPFDREEKDDSVPLHRKTYAKQTLPFDREEKDDSVPLHRKTHAKQTLPFDREEKDDSVPLHRKTHAKQTLPFDREEKDDSVSLHRKTHAKQTLPFDREEKDDSVPLYRKNHTEDVLPFPHRQKRDVKKEGRNKGGRKGKGKRNKKKNGGGGRGGGGGGGGGRGGGGSKRSKNNNNNNNDKKKKKKKKKTTTADNNNNNKKTAADNNNDNNNNATNISSTKVGTPASSNTVEGGSWVTLCQVGRAFYLLTDLCLYAFLFSLSLYYTLIVLDKELTFNRLVAMFLFGMGVPVLFLVLTILLYTFLPTSASFGISCTVDSLVDEIHWATTAPKLICVVLSMCLMTVSTYGFWRLHVPALHASSETFYARQGVLKTLALLLACSLAELFALVSEYQRMYGGGVSSLHVQHASTAVLGMKGVVLAFLVCFLDSEVMHSTCCSPVASDGEPWLSTAPTLASSSSSPPGERGRGKGRGGCSVEDGVYCGGGGGGGDDSSYGGGGGGGGELISAPPYAYVNKPGFRGGVGVGVGEKV
ncbi:uncharacterized protein LOC143276814 [Babylonia areolata]|uniref:uncharacterized protein LOC143276814 n=1 Tax=Babylonia areolata TaxID=304850 RepID=UPI003FD1408A